MELKRDGSVDTPELIERYLCCAKCLKEVAELGTSPVEYGRNCVGITKQGIQVWCVRHNCNVAHFLIGPQDIEPCQCCGGGLH